MKISNQEKVRPGRLGGLVGMITNDLIERKVSSSGKYQGLEFGELPKIKDPKPQGRFPLKREICRFMDLMTEDRVCLADAC